MGWGEPTGPSAELVRRNTERAKANVLATVVEAFLAAGTTGNVEHLADAVGDYRDAQKAARHG